MNDRITQTVAMPSGSLSSTAEALDMSVSGDSGSCGMAAVGSATQGGLDVLEMAKSTARSIYQEASDELDTKKAEGLATWAKQSRSAQRCDAMVKMARGITGIPIDASELDANPWLLNFKNGSVDLRTGELRAADRDDLLTMTTGFDFDPDALCPRIDDFLNWVTCGRKDLGAEIRRVLGYTITGSTAERTMLILYGTGSNGSPHS